MRRVLCSLTVLAALAALSLPAKADSDVGRTNAPVKGQVTVHQDGSYEVQPFGSGAGGRVGKYVSYDNLTQHLIPGNYFYFTTATRARADDITMDKSIDPTKNLLNRMDFIYFSFNAAGQGAPDTVKIDLYDLFANPPSFLPNTATKFATFSVPVLPGGYLYTVQLTPPIPKPDTIWWSIQGTQNRNTNSGVALGGTLTGTLPPTIGSSDDVIARNLNKDNNAGWELVYFGGNPLANFALQLWNSPEPATLVLLAGAAVGLLRRRR